MTIISYKPKWYFEAGKTQMLVLGLFVIIYNYFWFVYKKRYKAILKEFDPHGDIVAMEGAVPSVIVALSFIGCFIIRIIIN